MLAINKLYAVSVLFVRIITKSTKAVLFGFSSDEDIGFVTRRGAFHSQKISYTLGKNPFVFKKNPPKIRKNPFVMKESRTLFRKSEMPLVTRDVLEMGACNKMPTAQMHITILETKAELFDVFKHDSLEPIKYLFSP